MASQKFLGISKDPKVAGFEAIVSKTNVHEGLFGMILFMIRLLYLDPILHFLRNDYLEVWQNSNGTIFLRFVFAAVQDWE